MSRIVLITGTSSGIGSATARAFLNDGWTVYATARSVEDIEDLAREGCETARLDVTDPTTISAVLDEIYQAEGHLDCLVNNAGYGQFGVVEDVTPEQMQAQFEVNLFGVHRLVRAVLPHMRERRNGTIVNVSSVAGWFPLPAKGAYNASKFALRGLTETLQAEVEQFGIDVALVEPGFVDTGFHETADEMLADVDTTTDYDELYDQVMTYERVNAQEGIEPSAVADEILAAAGSDSSGGRHPVGMKARLISLLSWLPVGLRTKLWSLAADRTTPESVS